uniref:Cytochrome P450 n=1 Tax=Solanum lycopersicum TaxID=4081 RepID=A0A3Q7EKZ2_SOLLC
MDVLYTIFISIAILLLICVTPTLVLTVRIYAGKSIRNPKYAPVEGNVFHQLLYFNIIYDYQTELAKKTPTFRLLAPEQSEIYTTDSRNIEHILKTNFSKYSKGKRNQEVIMDLFGEGIFAVDGEKWKQQRKLASFEFSARVLRDFSCKVFRKGAAKLVSKVSEFSLANQVFDMQELLMRCSLESIFKVGFGVDLNCLDGSSGDDNEFIKAFDDSNALSYWRYVDPFWKLKRYFNIGSEFLLKKNIKFIQEFVDELIRTRRKQLEMKQDSMDKEDILSRFLVESKKDPEKMTDRYLRDIILNFMLAGKDSTANTLSWFFYVLCKNPLIQIKIVEEIREVIGNNMKDNGSVDDFVASITEEVLEKMHYLHATLTETLRLYPAVPVDGRCADADDVLPDGFHVKKGDGVYYMSYAMGRMPYVWGNDAQDFRPERWLKDGIFQPESPFKFITFHAGPRLCLGKDFAYRQMKILSMALLHFFRFKSSDDTKEVTYRTMFTLHIKEGLQVRTLCVISVTSFLVLILRIYAGKSIRNPKSAPVIGTVFHQLFYFKRLYDYQTEVAKKLPTSRFLAPDESIICTTDSRNVEHILKTKFGKYSKGKRNEEIIMDLFGKGIFAVDGEKWKQQRKLASLEFSARVLRDFSCTVFRKRADKLVRKVFQFYISNQVFDIQELLMRCSLDSIFKVGFGVDLNCLDGSGEDDDSFIKAFDDSNELIYWRYVDPFWKLKRYFNIGSEALLKKNIKFIHEFVDELIRSRRKQLEEDILSRFLEESKKDPEKMTDQYLRDIILNFMLAGKDSTANTLSWFFYMLCKNPLIQEKVVEEITEVIGNNVKDKEHLEYFVASITEEALEKMHYLHAALTETLRLYPAVPVDGRCADADDILPDGFHIRKGDEVNYVSYAMGRMPYIWGNDAEDFRPERWLKDGIFQPESPFKFIAFHAGPRICLGKDFAYKQMKILAMALLHFFRFKLSDETKVVTYRTIYHPIGGTIFNQLINFHRLHHYMTDLACKYKTYRLISPFRNEIYTSDPANVEYILKTNFDNYGKGWYNYSILKDLFGDGIFTVDGDKWQGQRKLSSHEFSTRVLRDFSSVVFRKNVAKLAHVLSNAANSNTTVDIQDLFMKSTQDSIFRVACGVDLDSICGSNEESKKFGDAFDNANAMTTWRYVDVFWKIKRALNIGVEAKLRDNIRTVDWKKEDILSRFLQISGTNPKYLRDIILNFVIAGKDTTATTLSWFIYVLCKYPHVQEKVAQEIKESTTEKENATDITDFAANVSEDALEKMQYLHAALTETLRLYPSIPTDPKLCFSDDTFPDGFSVNKGDMVSYLPYAMGRMKFIWGDDAEEYKPERWLDRHGFFRHESPFKFTAFQAGPRICLGKQFAYRQMKIFSAVLLHYFVFKLSDDKNTVNYRTMISLQIAGGLHVDRLHHYMTDLAAKYKTYRLISPFRNKIYTSDPANVEYILKTNIDNYGKGWYNYSILKDLLGNGIFAVDGDKWREQRKLLSHEFSTRVSRDFSSVVFRKNVAKLAQILSESANSNKAVDIQDLFMQSSLDSIIGVAFGAELDNTCGSNEEDKRFIDAFDNANATTTWRYTDIFWKIKRALNIGVEGKLRDNIRTVDAFVYKLIHIRTEQMNPKYLRDIILSILLSGKDTTSTTLSWFIYVLCKYPHVQEKVVQEIKEATTEKTNATDITEFAANVSEEALVKMQYLHAALTETLRLYPAVPLDPKICFSDDTLPDGFSVNKGDVVCYLPYAMGRMKFIWGDDAEEYKPERWLDRDGFFRPENPFKFTAFQAGPRICLGKEFAYRQMKIFSAVLLSYFVFKLSDDKKAINYRTMINLHIDGGLHVRVFRR